MRNEDESSPPEGSPFPASVDFLVVGIGASAGGLAALQSFFERVPADPGAAFVVVVHLSPTHLSDLPELLQAKTPLPVASVDSAMPIEPNRVYVIAPNCLLTMNDGFLQVSPLPPNERGVAIDRFFRSLAVEQS